jgi:hypothetical protein
MGLEVQEDDLIILGSVFSFECSLWANMGTTKEASI